MARGEDEHKRAHKEKLKHLREQTHKKVDYHMKKAYVDAGDFYHLVREFFLELLDKKYEATYEELAEEIESMEHEFVSLNPEQRANARLLLMMLSENDYRGEDLTVERAHKMLSQFKDLVNEITTHTGESIDYLLHQGVRLAKEGHLSEAKKLYVRARVLYDKMSDSQKKQYFDSMDRLFSLLKE